MIRIDGFVRKPLSMPKCNIFFFDYSYLDKGEVNYKIIKERDKMSEDTSTPTEKIDWDVNDPNSIMEACARFLELKKKSFIFCKLVDEKYIRCFEFDQNHPPILYTTSSVSMVGKTICEKCENSQCSEC